MREFPQGGSKMTSISGLSPHFAVVVYDWKLEFMPKWGEVLILRPFLSFQWVIFSILN